MNLYNLTQNYAELFELLYDDEADEQAVLDTLEAIEGAIEVKAENIGVIIREMSGDIKKLQDEEKRLNERRMRLEYRQNRLKQSLMQAMGEVGVTKMKTPLFSFTVANNGGKLPLKLLVDVQDLPPEFRKVKYEADSEALREACESGWCEYAELGERGKHLLIK